MCDDDDDKSTFPLVSYKMTSSVVLKPFQMVYKLLERCATLWKILIPVENL